MIDKITGKLEHVNDVELVYVKINGLSIQKYVRPN